jgi:hypothetical protein
MDKNHKETTESPQVDANRRRLTKAGLAAPAVLGVLASRKVLAEAPWNCTVSGQISGNISRPGAVACSTVGQGFSAYNVDGTNWPPSCTNYFPSTGNGCNFNQALDFSAVPALLTTKFRDAFTMPQGSGTRPATILEVYNGAAGLASLSANISLEFGREALLALLNSYFNPTSNPNGFPLSPGDVVAMFNAIAISNSYNTGIPGAAPWNGATVLAYWKMLHP